MKRRDGFVSNSSTSSFIIGKNFMNDKQIVELRDWLGEIDGGNDYYTYEVEYYFGGGGDNDPEFEIMKKLREMGLQEMGLQEFVSHPYVG